MGFLALPIAWTGVVLALSAGSRPAHAQTPVSDADWSRLLSTGQARYQRICGVCHGARGEEGDDGPDIRNKGYAPDKVRGQVRNGSGKNGKKMKAIPIAKLSEPDLDAVLVYLDKIGTAKNVRGYLAGRRSP